MERHPKAKKWEDLTDKERHERRKEMRKELVAAGDPSLAKTDGVRSTSGSSLTNLISKCSLLAESSSYLPSKKSVSTVA